MIVRESGDVLQLITQPDHAALARRVMSSAVGLDAHERRASILRAVAGHDNGWAEEDAALTVNPATGGVFDFISVPLEVRHRVWPRGVGRLADDPWAAALVAHHAVTVYERFHGDAAWASFFADMESTRDRLIGAARLTPTELADDYPFLRLGDLISLAFCTGSTAEQHIAQWSVRLIGSRVVVTPEPFGGSDVPMEIAAREIPRRRYESDAELRAAVAAARTTMLAGAAGR